MVNACTEMKTTTFWFQLTICFHCLGKRLGHYQATNTISNANPPMLQRHMTWLGHNVLKWLCYCRDGTILEGVVPRYYISYSSTFLVLISSLSAPINIEFCPPHFFTDKQMVWIRYQTAANVYEKRLLLIYYSFHSIVTSQNRANLNKHQENCL